LITGPTEAVLIDAHFLREDVSALGDLIEESGKRLTTIYVTHGHADHYLGFAELIQRFPTARAVATAPVIESLIEGISRQKEIWGQVV
jgi:glyoxylase-like metal-dependent hydrolase (beta-lactamase superfamily II)